MRDDHRSELLTLPQSSQFCVEFMARYFVERTKRLIEQEQCRAGDERARNRHPHLHATRQLMRKAPRSFRQLHARDSRISPVKPLLARHAVEFERQRHVVDDAAPWQEPWLLKAIAQSAEAAFHAASIERFEPAHHAEQRGLAAA